MTVVPVDVDDDGNLVHLDADGNVVPVAVPQAPDGLSDYAVERWRQFWMSPPAALVRMETHGEALTHWIWLVHQREALRELYMRQPFVQGARAYKQPDTVDADGNVVPGEHRFQVVDNPAYRQWRDISEQVAKYEEAFGMTPLGQLRLGVEFLIGQRLSQGIQSLPRGPRRPQLVVDEEPA